MPFDIALIQMKEDSSKEPCKLGTAASGPVTAVGWGLNERGFPSPVLQHLNLKVVELDQCRLESAPGFATLVDSQMCAKGERKAEDVCAGQLS